VNHDLIVGASRSRSDTSHPVGFLWTIDRPEAETTTWQHTTLRVMHAKGGIRTNKLCKRAAVDQRLKPRGRQDHTYSQLPISEAQCNY